MSSPLITIRISNFHIQDPSSPVLQSDKAFELYLSALAKNGLEPSINAAVRRRDGILAAGAVAATPSSDPTPQASSLESTPSTENHTPVTETPAPASPTPSTPSRSELVAQKILSGGALNSTTGPVKLDSAQLAAAVAGGAGVSGNPIHVTLAECESKQFTSCDLLLTFSEAKGSWVYKSMRFLVFTALGFFCTFISPSCSALSEGP